MLLDDGHGVQSVLLGQLSLDLGQDRSQVGGILVIVMLVSKLKKNEV